ncbi:MAG: hypothetical protein ACI9JM_000621 [Halioglobus sp.]|jgi:hypothetical protein
MKKYGLLLLITSLFLSFAVQAKNQLKIFPIAEAMGSQKAQKVIDGGYQFKFSNQQHREIIAHHGDYSPNDMASTFLRTSDESCQAAFVSAMGSFQSRIKRKGGNAVVNIRSIYEGKVFNSTGDYECAIGSVLVGVTFIGDIVTLAEPEPEIELESDQDTDPQAK